MSQPVLGWFLLVTEEAVRGGEVQVTDFLSRLKAPLRHRVERRSAGG